MPSIPKIKRNEFNATPLNVDLDIAGQAVSFTKTLTRKDGVGGELICSFTISRQLLKENGIETGTPEMFDFGETCLEQSIERDLQEINHEGPYANMPMDDAIHDLRLELGLETVL